jgi:single stranded DNA-binding protein (ssb)
MNFCHFSGRLVADAETRYTGTGTPITNFRIAVDSGYGEHKRTDFINCVLWKKEQLAPHLTKGKPVIVTGEYQGREYEDRSGGKQRIVEIIVRDVEFQQGQPKGHDAPQQSGQQSRNQGQQRRQEDDLGPAFPSEAAGMDDVPF